MKKLGFLFLLFLSGSGFSQIRLDIPGEILSSVVRADKKILALSTTDSIYLISTADLVINERWAHHKEMPVLLGFHPVNPNILLMQAQGISVSQFSGGLLGFGMSRQAVLANYRRTDRKYNELPGDSVYMWDLSRKAIVNTSPGTFYLQFGNSDKRFLGIGNLVFPFESQGKTRYGTRGSEWISREGEFQKRSVSPKSCRQLLLSPKQDLFAASWRDGYINDTLWFSVSLHDFKTHETRLTLDRIADMPQDLCFSEDGKLLAVAAQWNPGEETAIRIFSIPDKKQIGEIPEASDNEEASNLKFSADGKELYFRSDRNDWYAWDIANARFAQKIWANLTALSQINAAIYLGNSVLMIGESWPPGIGIPSASDKSYIVEQIAMPDIAVLSKTDQAGMESYADSTRFTMMLNDALENNANPVLHFSTDKKIFTGVEGSVLKVWHLQKRKKLLQLGFDQSITAYPDRFGKNIFVIEEKIQKYFSEYVMHRLTLSNSTRASTATITPGQENMKGSVRYCHCAPDPARDNTWLCTDESETVWEVSGATLRMKPLTRAVGASLRKIRLDPDGTLYALSQQDNKANEVWSWDRVSDPKRIIAATGLSEFSRVNKQIWLWNTGYRDSLIEVWENGQKIRVIRFGGYIEGVDISANGSDAVVQYTIRGDRYIQRFVSGVAQTPHNTHEISTRFFMTGTDELLAENNGFSTRIGNGAWTIPWTVNTPQILDITNFDISPSGRFVLLENRIIDLKETDQWEISRFSPAAFLQDSVRLSWLEIYKTISYGDKKGGFTLMRLTRGNNDTLKGKTWIPEPAGEGSFYYAHDRVQVSPDKKWALTYRTYSSFAKKNAQAPPLLWNLQTMTGKSISGLPDFTDVGFSPEGEKIWFRSGRAELFDTVYIQTTYEYMIGSGKARTFRERITTMQPTHSADQIRVGRKSVSFIVKGTMRVEKTYYSREDLEKAVYSPQTGTIIAGTSSGSLVFWDRDGNASPVAQVSVHGYRILQMELRGNRLYTLASNGEVGVTDLADRRIQVVIKTLRLDNEIRFAMHIPGDYYRVDPDLMRYMHFVKNGDVYPLSSFELQGNRPDKVYSSIGFSDSSFISSLRQSWIGRLSREGFDPAALDGSAPRPEVEWNRDALPALTTDPVLPLRFSVKEKSGNLKQLFLRVNGVPVGSRQGIPLTPGSKTMEMNPSVTLNEGPNLISIIARNDNGMESLEETFETVYQPVQKKKKTLVFAGIGVSAYADTTWNLRYAAKDARDLAATLRYAADSVRQITILDEKATKEGILAVKEILKKTSVDDIVILSFAGHGVLTEEKGFFFAPHDMDFNRPDARGISMEMIEDLLDDIPARKRLLLIDACHSGENWAEDTGSRTLPEGVKAYAGRGGILTSKKASSGAGSRTSYLMMKELFNDFTRGNGAFVISAAGSQEFAYEGLKGEENGVFTRSCIEAIYALWEKGRYSDKNENTIRVRDLRKLIYQKVSALTNGLQNPTSRQENGWWNWSF